MPGYKYGGTVFDAHESPRTLQRPTCGRTAGYYAHRKAGERACDDCRNAYNIDQCQRRAAKKTAA
jgi:hypothetical protein